MTTARGVAHRSPGANARVRSRLSGHARSPVLRDGYALALNSGITAVVGLAYWVVAAHVYSPAVVGMNSALISAMLFVAGVSTLNLSNVLVRFLPGSGAGARRLVGVSYAVTTATAVLLTAGLILGLVNLPGNLSFFEDTRGLAPAFALATIVWGIFVLQDGVLTGIGRAVFVPIENGAFAVLKLGLLVLFASTMSSFGIFASWAMAMALSVIAVNALLFVRLLPSRGPAVRAPSLVRTRAFAEYFVADWTCATAWLAGTTLLPVVVTSVAGPDTNATFALAWAVAFPLYAASTAIGTALVVHGSKDPAELPALLKRSSVQGAAILAASVAAMVLVAPLALRLFGESYAADGVPLLRILALAALPNLVVTLWLSNARVRRRLRVPAIALCGQAALTLVLVGPLLNAYGAEGAGLAWLAGQVLVAAAVLVAGAISRRPRRRDAMAVRALIGEGALRRVRTDSDMSVVATIGDRASPRLIKLGSSTTAMARLQRHVEAVATLRAMPGLEGWRALLPEITASGDTWVVERALPGIDGRRMLPEQVLNASAKAIAPLYEATAGDEEEEILSTWVTSRSEVLERVTGQRGRALIEQLLRDVRGRAARGGWVHGDLWPGNLLLAGDGSAITGIVDWEAAQAGDLPIADVGHLLVCTRALASGRSLGTVVRRLADGRDELKPSELRLLASLPPQSDRLDTTIIARLGWLQHVTVRLAQIGDTPSALWMHRTIRPVLAAAP